MYLRVAIALINAFDFEIKKVYFSINYRSRINPLQMSRKGKRKPAKRKPEKSNPINTINKNNIENSSIVSPTKQESESEENLSTIGYLKTFIRETFLSIFPLDTTRIRKREIFYLFLIATTIAMGLDYFYPRYYREFSALGYSERVELVLAVNPKTRLYSETALDTIVKTTVYYIRSDQNVDPAAYIIISDTSTVFDGYFIPYGELYPYLKDAAIHSESFQFMLSKTLKYLNTDLKTLVYQDFFSGKLNNRLKQIYNDRAIFLFDKVMHPIGTMFIYLAIMLIMTYLLNMIFRIETSNTLIFRLFAKIYIVIFIISLPFRYILPYYVSLYDIHYLHYNSFLFAFSIMVVMTIFLHSKFRISTFKSLAYSILMLLAITIIPQKIIFMIGYYFFRPLSDMSF